MHNISYGIPMAQLNIYLTVNSNSWVDWYDYFEKKNRQYHDDVIKQKHFPRYWPFVRRIHRSPVNSSHKSQWREALMFSLICAWVNAWVNNRRAGDLRRQRALYDVIVMFHQDATLHAGSGQSTTGLVTTSIRQQSVYCINTLRPRDTYMRQLTNRPWFR